MGPFPHPARARWRSDRGARLLAQLLRAWLIWCLASAAMAASADELPAPARPQLAHITESAGGLTLEQVRQLPEDHWLPLPSPDGALGFVRQTHWFRADFEPVNTAGDFRLEIGYPFLDHVELSVRLGDDGAWKTFRMGDQLPFRARPYQHQHFVVPLRIEAGQSVRVFARVSTSSSMQLPLRLWQADAQRLANLEEMLFQGAYFGIVLGLLVYNLMLFFATGEKSFLAYVAWVASISLTMLTLKGLSFQYLWPDFPALNDRSLSALVGLSLASALDFHLRFLLAGGGHRRLATILRLVVLASLAMVVIGFLIPYFIAIQILLALIGVGATTALVLTGLRIREGFRPAIILGIAWMALHASALALILQRYGVMAQSFWIVNAPQVGSAIEMILASVALGIRVRDERRMRVRAQAHALEVQARAREQLEQQVQERTRDLAESNQRLATLSERDWLTGSYNRRYFDAAFSRAVETAREKGEWLSVAFIDADHFKRINDTLGHAAGDACLKSLARLLESHLLHSDDIAARFGGEEFCVLLPGASKDEALQFAERIRLAAESMRVAVDGRSISMTVSIGLSSRRPRDQECARAMLAAADSAVYDAKANGRNQVVWQDVAARSTDQLLADTAVTRSGAFS
ncbi:MAG: diguanylate cyclase [Burkholderiaceae bacterium]